jgi:hypothetical protein
MPKKVYGGADSVQEIAESLIPAYHPEIATARIEYVFVSEASKKNGRPVLGKARRVSGVLEYLLEKDFMIEVALDCWNEASNHERTALVDHLLESCTGEEDDSENGTGEMKWSMRTPDVQEFTSILHRHGAWNETLQGMVDVAQRLNIESRVQEVASEVSQGEV